MFAFPSFYLKFYNEKIPQERKCFKEFFLWDFKRGKNEEIEQSKLKEFTNVCEQTTKKLSNTFKYSFHGEKISENINWKVQNN